MKKMLLVVFAAWLWCLSALATDNLRLPDVRSLGMGGNGGAHSALFNPSLLGLQTAKSLRADYYSRYSMKELATLSGGFCYPNRTLPVGLHVASFGYDEYRESLFRLSAGKRLNASWALGIGVQYAVLQSEIFESDITRISTDIGIAFQPVDNLLTGLSIINSPSVSLNDEGIDSKRIGAYLAALDANWYMMNDVLITAGIAHCEETPLSASLGMEYLATDDFHLRAGVRTSPFQPSLGIGYRFNGVMIDAVMIYHPVLGASLGLGLSYSF
ncbi:MAG: hypothetical protein LBF89_04910 [Bacteroidales bacterium]|jgi:hypothetical protein|nr:hypothetical protein [Bacteroidales bacterium]